ncbi:hypothetical protein Pcinc_002240 [Petrolisthes cinctipes]|uniref:Uncharacterized protein n=1 Tax=Petrolisthes cinctipes TaxID=88211 RepID=A0AAE1GLB8_PETCI|nr:hypothetical protein Pcinc_002240 [Petrolisthes cinctipes]
MCEDDLEWIMNEAKEMKQEQVPLFHNTSSSQPSCQQEDDEEEGKEEKEDDDDDDDEEEEERHVGFLTEESPNVDIGLELTHLQRRKAINSSRTALLTACTTSVLLHPLDGLLRLLDGLPRHWTAFKGLLDGLPRRWTAFKGLSTRACITFCVSRAGTATLSRLKAEVLTRRIDSLQQQAHDTRKEVTGLLHKILDKMNKT